MDLTGPVLQHDRHAGLLQTPGIGLAFVGEDVVTGDRDEGRRRTGEALRLQR